MNQELSANFDLSHYRILSKLGAGGMGEVYLAHDTKLDRKVALKILPGDLAVDHDRMARFVREAKSASALNHPNIITIHEIGESEGTHFIATEYIDGRTLNDYANSNPLQLKAALEIAIQIASALAEAHAAGIVHRDLKPDNVMVRANGLVKILDFGIAKLSEAAVASGLNIDEEAATALKTPSTSPGMIIGTANYMSPEQAKGKEVDGRTDIFSFGIVLYEMIASAVPFDGATPIEKLGAILHKEPNPLPDDVPTDIRKIIHKCLRKDRDERYQTIKDVLIDLKDVKQELEAQKLLERTVAPDKGEVKTEIRHATTVDEIARATTNQTHSKSSATKYGAIALALLLISALVFVGFRYFKSGTNRIESIAVMPFVNESGNADVEYLSDGMTETLISSLSQIPNLSVKARSTVFFYKGKETTPKKIGEELGVQAVLLGRVAQRGADLRLSLELVNAQTQDVLWSETYNRKQSDLITLQSDVARDVSSRLKTKLSGSDEAKVTKTYTADPEAYDLYLKGNFYKEKYNQESYKKAIEFYEKAIAKDPKFALPYVGMGFAYNTSANWYLPSSEAMPKAKAAGLKAIGLDDSLADAYDLLGIYEVWYGFDWAACEKNFKRAIELGSKIGHGGYSYYLLTQGNLDQAVSESRLDTTLQPLNLNSNTNAAFVLVCARRYDEALEQARKTIELDPNHWGGYEVLGLAYAGKRQYPEAIAALEKARSLDGNPDIQGYLGHVYAVSGDSVHARKILDELMHPAPGSNVWAGSVACIYAGLNDKDKAFEWLNKALLDDHSGAIINVDPPFQNLRDDPRYKDLRRQMNLPD